MMNKSMRIVNYLTYLLFSIGILSSCSNSPKNDTSISKLGNVTGKYIVKIDSLRINMNKPRVYTISINDMKFQPKILTVHKGDTVIWVNHDLVAHCVTETRNKAWTSSEIPSGGSWKMGIAQSCDYFCAIHPVMKGKIVME
jgi:plastocyanin